MSKFDLTQIEVDSLPKTPFPILADWLDAAAELGLPNPTAMTLATATRAGAPSARVVLLKSFDERGLVFFTNYESQKARELADNPRAAVVFHWDSIGRQVRISGTVGRTTREVSEAYFQSRPRNAQVGAWASQQSAPVASRAEIEARVAEIARRFPSGNLPLPADWGGYLIEPERCEFWQSRADRLHDRFRYTRTATGWQIERVFP